MFNFGDSGIDVVGGSSYKWLLGGIRKRIYCYLQMNSAFPIYFVALFGFNSECVFEWQKIGVLVAKHLSWTFGYI